MLAQQSIPPAYPMPSYSYSNHRTIPYQPAALDINWFDTWPTIRSILLGCMMLLSSVAVIGLDIANLAIEGHKTSGVKGLGMGPAKVGVGIWSGSISFLAAIFILMIIFVQNKRIAATFALIAVTLALAFTIVLVGLTANSIQTDQNSTGRQYLYRAQYKLIIAILSIGLFIITQCITFFVIYISVFFSSSTRHSMKYY